MKGKTKGGMLHAQGRRGKVRYHPHERHDRFRLRFTPWQRNGEEPNDKPRKDTSINTRAQSICLGHRSGDNLVEWESL